MTDFILKINGKNHITYAYCKSKAVNFVFFKFMWFSGNIVSFGLSKLVHVGVSRRSIRYL